MAPWPFIQSMNGWSNDKALAATPLERVSSAVFDVYDTGIRRDATPILVHDLGDGTAVVGGPGTILSEYLDTGAVELEERSPGEGIGAAIALDKLLKQPIRMLSEAARLRRDLASWASLGPRAVEEVAQWADALGLDRATTDLDATLSAWRKAGNLAEVADRCWREKFTLVHPDTVPASQPTNGQLFAA